MKNENKWFGIITIISVIGFILSGCASLAVDQGKFYAGKNLNITTVPGNATIVVSDKRGNIVAQTLSGQNGTARIEIKGKSPYSVEISKDGYFTEKLVIVKKANKYYYQNIPFMVVGIGVLGLMVDAMFGYPVILAPNPIEISLKPTPEYLEQIAAAEEAERQRIAEQEARQIRQRAEQEQARQAEQERLANLYRQAGNNVGNLRNTSRSFTRASILHNANLTTTYDFGDGNFIATDRAIGTQWGQKTGTFRVNGDTVIFLSPEGVYSFGTIIGNILTIDGNVYR